MYDCTSEIAEVNEAKTTSYTRNNKLRNLTSTLASQECYQYIKESPLSATGAAGSQVQNNPKEHSIVNSRSIVNKFTFVCVKNILEVTKGQIGGGSTFYITLSRNHVATSFMLQSHNFTDILLCKVKMPHKSRLPEDKLLYL